MWAKMVIEIFIDIIIGLCTYLFGHIPNKWAKSLIKGEIKMNENDQKELIDFFVYEDIRITNINKATEKIENQLKILKAQREALYADIKEIKKRLRIKWMILNRIGCDVFVG